MSFKACLLLFSCLFLASCNYEETEVAACNGSISIKASQVLDAVQDQAIGSILVEAAGGIAPYEFSINGGGFTKTNKFENLRAGTYTLLVKDQNGCEGSSNLIVNEQLIVSYKLQIVPILQTNCMVAGCHCTGNPLCFGTYDQVVANHLGIRDRTFNRAMPPANSGKILSDNEIKEISNWVYQGLRNN